MATNSQFEEQIIKEFQKQLLINTPINDISDKIYIALLNVPKSDFDKLPELIEKHKNVKSLTYEKFADLADSFDDLVINGYNRNRENNLINLLNNFPEIVLTDMENTEKIINGLNKLKEKIPAIIWNRSCKKSKNTSWFIKQLLAHPKVDDNN